MSIKRFDWQWNVPEDINIGHLCSSIHLGSDVENKLAMIVENDELGTSQITFKELAKKNRSVRSVSFKFWLKKRRSRLNPFT
jgi:acyl-coenzyme A synthetase/AMP-(fatty) acid ligase